MKKRSFLQSLFALPAVVAVPALLKQQAAFGPQADGSILFDGVSILKAEAFSLNAPMALTLWYKAVRTPSAVVWRDMLTGKDGPAPQGWILSPTEVRVYSKAHDAETRLAIIEDMRHTA